MGNFDQLYKEIMESNVIGGENSVMGNPESGEVGSHGNAVGNKDFYSPGTSIIPKSLFGKVQTRTGLSGKKKKKK